MRISNKGNEAVVPKKCQSGSGLFLLLQRSEEGQKQRPREGAQRVLGSQQGCSGKGSWTGIGADKQQQFWQFSSSAIKKSKFY